MKSLQSCSRLLLIEGYFFTEILFVFKMSIGPSLPPHLQHLARQDKEEEEDSSSSESEDDIGPRLPEVPCRGPAPVGPQLPPPSYQLATAPPGTGTY